MGFFNNVGAEVSVTEQLFNTLKFNIAAAQSEGEYADYAYYMRSLGYSLSPSQYVMAPGFIAEYATYTSGDAITISTVSRNRMTGELRPERSIIRIDYKYLGSNKKEYHVAVSDWAKREFALPEIEGNDAILSTLYKAAVRSSPKGVKKTLKYKLLIACRVHKRNRFLNKFKHGVL